MSAPSWGGRIRAVGALWWAGCWDALQVQRCVVLCVEDRSHVVLGKVARCIQLNLLIYLGSIACNTWILRPAADWLLEQYALPVYGATAVSLWRSVLLLLFNVLWLLPAYVICLAISCHWYNQIATAAFQAKQDLEREPEQPHKHEQPPKVSHDGSTLKPVPANTVSATRSASSSGSLEGVAQELYRTIFFLVFYTQVWLISNLPYVGPVLNVVFLSWLYAYYCYDYKWSLQGIRLSERLAFVERRWAFFAGFGFPCTISTVFLPFYVGAALCNLLFPLFVLVACASDPTASCKAAVAGNATGVNLGRIPIFNMALWPTDQIVRRLFARGSAQSK